MKTRKIRQRLWKRLTQIEGEVHLSLRPVGVAEVTICRINPQILRTLKLEKTLRLEEAQMKRGERGWLMLLLMIDTIRKWNAIALWKEAEKFGFTGGGEGAYLGIRRNVDGHCVVVRPIDLDQMRPNSYIYHQYPGGLLMGMN